jgi:hypothetical protein
MSQIAGSISSPAESRFGSRTVTATARFLIADRKYLKARGQAEGEIPCKERMTRERLSSVPKLRDGWYGVVS